MTVPPVVGPFQSFDSGAGTILKVRKSITSRRKRSRQAAPLPALRNLFLYRPLERPRLPIRTFQHLCRFRVSDDLLVLRIPFQLIAPQPHGDIAEMADRDGAMCAFDGCDRLPAGDHAVDEVPEVIVTLVEVDLVRPDL